MTTLLKTGAILPVILFLLRIHTALAIHLEHGKEVIFPHPLNSYGDADLIGIGEILLHRISEAPFNLIASLIFLCAVVHTFLTSRFLAISHQWKQEHERKQKAGQVVENSAHLGAGIFHFLGEVEAVFGIWAIVLGITIATFYDWPTFIYYIGEKVNYTEPMFVVVIMTLASSRPMLKFSELMMWKIAQRFGGTLTAWWFTILTLGPILGSFITESAAITISALLLSTKFYNLNPSEQLKYGTIALLFVNISVGGTLSHFAAPPILMVSGKWHWDLMFMLQHFGWKAIAGIGTANIIYYYIFRREMDELEKRYSVIRHKKEIQSKYIKREELESEFARIRNSATNELGFTKAYDEKCDEIKEHLKSRILQKASKEKIDMTNLGEAFDQRFEDIKLKEMRRILPGLLPIDKRPPYRDPYWDNREDWVPVWIMIVHICFVFWTVINAHHAALFVAGFLFFLGFTQVTYPFQNRFNLKPALMVGFFLAGLVIHGGVQAWWISPVLGRLSEIPLMISATILTAFNDNAAITYLSTLVPGLTAELKYSVVAGAVTGGGLTIIANAPNPAGQSILKQYFRNSVSPLLLLKFSLIPTLIMGLYFMLL